MSDFKDGHNFLGHHQHHQQQEQKSLSLEPSQFGGVATNLFSSDPFPETEIRSFSELLAGAIVNQSQLELSNNNNSIANNASGFKQNRPQSLVLPPVTPLFNVSPRFSPSAFLNSPTFLSPLAGISPQQNLVHITSQSALLSQPNFNILSDTLSLQPSSIPSSNQTFLQPSIFNNAPTSRQPVPELSGLERKPPHHSNLPIAVDKPADDGYNWRKYGQKQVKGSEYPRSYYRCTSPNCPVKKKVERSYDGHITEIIYKGQHNHERPQNGRRGNKDGSYLGDEGQFGNSIWPSGGGGGREYASTQATSMQLNGPSDSEESGENSDLFEDDDDPNPKRRNCGAGQSDGGFTQMTMTEPKIVVQTRSDIDLLDDGYRWRKYGQKVVKGNPNPRSYYKCTAAGCKVRKHVERASTDQSAVITTYEGKHNHDVPAARGSTVYATNIETNTNTNTNNNQMKVHNSVLSFENNDQRRPITLRLKEEQVIA